MGLYPSPSSVPGDALASAIGMLVDSEVSPGGPYRNKKGIATFEDNVLIALFLQHNGVVLPQLNKFLEDSKPSISRHASIDTLVALYIFGQLDAYKAHYSTSWQSFCMQIRGSRADDASLSIVSRTLALVSEAGRAADVKNPKVVPLFDQIYTAAEAGCALYSEPLAGQLLNAVKRIRRADSNKEIAMLPYYFAHMLKEPTLSKETTLLKSLGVANVFCWVAYTIYDDIIDGEGHEFLVAVANVATRRAMVQCMHALRNEQVLPQIVNSYDAMDQANAWELVHTRFEVTAHSIVITAIPEYEDLTILSRRASGHGIGIDILTHVAQFTKSETESTRCAIDAYLIARQLNDDLHDWAEDLANGHCSYVVAQLLRATKLEPGVYNLKELQANLRRYFWKKGFIDISSEIMHHCHKARDLLRDVSKFKTQSQFEELINSIELSVAKSTKIYSEQQNFLKAYTKTS
jgi:hypothetical protein